MLEYFPKELDEPRQQQVEGLTFANNVFASGIKVVVLEMPTGSGKSGVAITASRAFGGGIIACPTIQLQAQYIKDFDNVAPLIGRGRFPCLKKDENAADCIPLIHEGRIPKKPPHEMSCAAAPCLNKPYTKRQRIKDECENLGGCPHQHSIDVAQESETIIANLHSLMYCVSLNEIIQPRRILIIDEAHDLKKFMRDFLKVKFKIRRRVDPKELIPLKESSDWLNWLKSPDQLDLLINTEMRDSYLERLEKLEKIGETVFQHWRDEDDGYLWIEFTPVSIANACQSMLFSLADKIILMSGTIYNKDVFLRPLGINPNDAAFLRINSDFPVENRRVILPRIRNLDLSHKNWAENFPIAIKEIQNFIDAHKDQKGIIHTNSYKMSKDINEKLTGNIISHVPSDFQDKLKEFLRAEAPAVFISPVCAQGVDFKNDLARWQIIVRPQYGSLSDPYVEYCLNHGFWGMYNYDAAVVLGQQLGRVVRSKDDYGLTYLLSSGFLNLINKSNYLLPNWLKQGFIKYDRCT